MRTAWLVVLNHHSSSSLSRLTLSTSSTSTLWSIYKIVTLVKPTLRVNALLMSNMLHSQACALAVLHKHAQLLITRKLVMKLLLYNHPPMCSVMGSRPGNRHSDLVQKQLIATWAVLLKRGWVEESAEERHAVFAQVEHTAAASRDTNARRTALQILEVSDGSCRWFTSSRQLAGCYSACLRELACLLLTQSHQTS